MQPDRAIHAAFRCAFNGLGGPLAATLAGKRVVGSGRLAAAYDRAAFDINLPAQTRAAFAKKADWFRLLANIGEKRERANASVAEPKSLGATELPCLALGEEDT